MTIAKHTSHNSRCTATDDWNSKTVDVHAVDLFVIYIGINKP